MIRELQFDRAVHVGNTSDQLVDVNVTSIWREAEGIRAFELRSEGLLPAFTAGAHVDVLLPGGIRRSYSLCNAQGERERYVIAVNLDPSSTGGSSYMHEGVAIGQRLRITEPRNAFPLDETAGHSVFFAGGIGITPIWSMIQRLVELGKSWELYYSARQSSAAAFASQIAQLANAGKGGVLFHFDSDHEGRYLDISAVLRQTPPESHLYCCGPSPMLAAYIDLTRGRPPHQVHLERFTNPVAPEMARGGASFTVVLARSGERVEVTPDQTILETLLAHGIDVPYSCRGGVCGSCETRVLAGTPDHRDHVLSEDDRSLNTSMMICCSRSITDELTLDL